jgi:stage V sporulation protein S
MEVLKVSANSKPNSVAGALAASLRDTSSKGGSQCCVEIQAVGAGAVNQAIKAIAITRGYVAPNGLDLIVIPAFSEVNIDGEARTAIKLIVESR